MNITEYLDKRSRFNRFFTRRDRRRSGSSGRRFRNDWQKKEE